MHGRGKPDNPGVHFPPPLVYVAGLLLGWLLNRWYPLPISGAAGSTWTTRVVIALVCFALFVSLSAPAFAAFFRAHTAFIPNRPATALVRSGPYRFTRNPMYVGMAAAYLGATLLGNSWWPMLFLPIVLVVISRAVIAREERYLDAAFPAEYAEYRRQVRRWL